MTVKPTGQLERGTKMRIALLAISVVLATTPSAPIFAAGTVATPAPAVRCSALKGDWKEVEISLSENKAEGLTDDSAPRATMRAAQDTAAYSKAALTLELMEANHCALPEGPPSSTAYVPQAVACRLAIYKATADQVKAGLPECDHSKW